MIVKMLMIKNASLFLCAQATRLEQARISPAKAISMREQDGRWRFLAVEVDGDDCERRRADNECRWLVNNRGDS